MATTDDRSINWSRQLAWMTDRITIARRVNFPLVASDCWLSPAATAATDDDDDDVDYPQPPTANAEINLRNSGPLEGMIFQPFA